VTETLRSPRFTDDRVLAACLAGELMIGPGSAGPAVARVQQALMDLTYSLRDYGPDGVFGRETADAVAAFNVDLGLGPDLRVVDGRTIRALDDRCSSTSSDRPAECGPDRVPGAGTPRLAWSGRIAPAEVFGRAVDHALAMVAEGAHYLEGAGGARPGGSDGMVARRGGVTIAPGDPDPILARVFAARCGTAGPQVCAGRFNARNGGIAGGRPAECTDTDLIVYLADLAGRPEAEWSPFYRFFSPRWIAGGFPDGVLVWGEDCRAKRHFDGTGLISWCLEQASVGECTVNLDMAGWASDVAGIEAVEVSEPPRKGDVLLRELDGRFSQIALMVGDDGAPVAEGLGHVVLAEQAGVGVVQRRFSPAGWSHRRRPAPG
jgi:peptidoglycan hydrolase-like protein with peptidoglycan-binding domain